jgi:pyrroloquinoline quinone (PQQ) biosynthesis protein C
MMGGGYLRDGELKNIASYPLWLQDVVLETGELKSRVVGHPLFAALRDCRLDEHAMRAFLINGWPVIDQFPQYMGMNLQKIGPEETPGSRMARRYLTRNIRVEQNHADYWVDWASAHNVKREELQAGDTPPLAYALSHWCWKSSNADSLPSSVAATNFAVEGVTGEWSILVCSSDSLEKSYPEDIRKKSMRWLKMHAHYDDAHPWEALDIVATLLGHAPAASAVRDVKRGIQRSYEYFRVSLDCCLDT